MTDQQPVAAQEEPSPVTEQFTFVLRTQQPDYHPGVVSLEQRMPRSTRYIGAVHVYNRSSAETTAGQMIAEYLYRDLCAERQGAYIGKGPRFDFSRDCSIQLVQYVGGWARQRQKHELGAVFLPEGLPASEVEKRLAEHIDTHWLPLPDLAYTLPDLIPSDTGAVLYSSSGFLHKLFSLEANFRVLEGPLIFIGADAQGEVTDVAAAHQGRNADGSLFQFYHHFAIQRLPLANKELLLDRGVHRFEEPLVLASETERLPPPEYWLDFWYRQELKVQGGLPYASVRDARWTFAGVEQELREALPNYAVYCVDCRRSFDLWGRLDAIEFPPAPGITLLLCPHCWYCHACKRWSTPTERDPQFTWRAVCTHHPSGVQQWLLITQRNLHVLEHQIVSIVQSALHTEQTIFAFSLADTEKLARRALDDAWAQRAKTQRPMVGRLFTATVTFPWGEPPSSHTVCPPHGNQELPGDTFNAA